MNNKAIEVNANGTHSAAVLPMRYLRHVGGCFLNGRAVVAYTDNVTIKLVAETTGGKRVCYSYEDRDGKQTRTIPALFLTPEQFAQRMEVWMDGIASSQDARIVDRAMADMIPNY